MIEEGPRDTMESVGLESVNSRHASHGTARVQRGSSDTSGSWYPGKYIRALAKKEGKEPSLLSEEERALADRIREEERLTSSGELDEEVGKEALICSTLRGVRNKFLDRRIVGKIFLSRMSGVVSTALTSKITEDDIARYLRRQAERSRSGEAHDPLVTAEITGQYKRAMSMTDTILNSLERRSLTWENVEFNHDTMLTRGATLGVSDPFLGMINFSITLQLSGTTASLLASRRRFEAARTLALSRTTAVEPSLHGSDSENDIENEASIMGLG